MSELRKVLVDSTLIHQTRKPPMKMLLCRSSDLSELTTKIIALRKLADMESVIVSLNREVLFASRFIHRIVRERIMELEKPRHVAL